MLYRVFIQLHSARMVIRVKIAVKRMTVVALLLCHAGSGPACMLHLFDVLTAKSLAMALMMQSVTAVSPNHICEVVI